jgi:hypothetical protein
MDIGIEQTDPVPELGQAQRQIDGDRRLPHTTFATGNGKDSPCTGKALQ